MIQSSGDGSCLGMGVWNIGQLGIVNAVLYVFWRQCPSSSSSRKSLDRLSTGAIAGIAVGLAILILLAAGAFFYFRRRGRAGRGAAAGLLGGAKYRAARSSAGTSTKSIEPPVTFWNANLFVREKTATTQVRDSLLSPLIPRPDLGPPTFAPRGTPTLHSKRDDELVSLVDPDTDSGSDSDVSEVLSTRSSHPPLSPTSSPNTPANTSRGHLPDGAEPASTTGGDAGSRSHGSRP
ncbi:hypothetical protein LXA43DRAFT_1133260 [Ganoderma leucocontextum]|nr:hypothetical protein LXA43DRAFT_1133260 [Ganoderma leucocontextum]